ncbi:hypothetical protein N5U18_06630 [Aliarcobacter butzleri]|uniref:hypothetical protein n=1 Tax=Aliarcobacter butzleri TaxID=28197 RepID=UPI0021B2E1A0|nr:hypothetical protein [Aliarcobacter butzleri]MCT7548152.1 hypothetical protein [Aliarcobacter butzleri]
MINKNSILCLKQIGVIMHTIKQVVASFQNLSIFYSVRRDSSEMLHLYQKAFYRVKEYTKENSSQREFKFI